MELRRKIPVFLLFGLAVFFCWFEIGRHGIFGSSVDWISQHSVIPEYFRQQFYATGEFFSEFAPGLGGGQNIYNFAYYGLYSPLLLPSYLLPFVKMGDYLMAVSVLTVAASAVVFYGWLRSRAMPAGVCFGAALLFVLAGPMIFHSARHVMFVNYMPFLCMALWGVDRYFEKRKMGVYVFGVFLMIMTSFYYSIGGMLALVIYGLHRYFWYREHPDQIPSEHSFFSRKHAWFPADGVRFLFPMATAVLLSAFFLFPTAAALTGKRGGAHMMELTSLFTPQLSIFHSLYSSYGVGLTTFLVTALIAGLFWKGWSSRALIWGSIAVLIFPVFMWLLNGALYVREKALIPFLPLFCYVIACYCVKVGHVWTMKEKRRVSYAVWAGILPYVLTIFLLYQEGGYTVEAYVAAAGNLVEEVCSGGYVSLTGRWTLVLFDALFMLVWYVFFQIFLWMRYRRSIKSSCPSGLLLVPPILFLALFGMSFRDTAGVESKEFYEQVNEKGIGDAIQKVLDQDTGFYRVEQIGTAAERAANINRVWDSRQYISSLYASSYNSAYQEFRMNTFDVEEATSNFMMQRISENPVFRKLMGVKYLVENHDEIEEAADAQNAPMGYRLYMQEGNIAVYQNSGVAPLCYATDRLISEKSYRDLEFPFSQTVLERYAVISGGGEQDWIDGENREAAQAELVLPELEAEEGSIEKTEEGYRILADKTWKVQAQLDVEGLPETSDSASNIRGQDILYLQFDMKNQKPQQSVFVSINGVQNRLASSSPSYFYYNGNTRFTYAVPIAAHAGEVTVTFGKGRYEIANLRCFLGNMRDSSDLYQSEFIPDYRQTKGKRICGQIDVKRTGCFITSIPYDENFKVKVDGRPCPIQKVNTAFLGFPIGEGEHTIEIVYHAPGVASGKLVSLLGIVVIFIWWIRNALKQEK